MSASRTPEAILGEEDAHLVGTGRRRYEAGLISPGDGRPLTRPVH